MLTRLALAGNPNLGVYVRATEDFAFVPPDVTAREKETIETTLEVRAIRTTIGGTRLVGSLLTGNSKGLIAADLVTREEMKVLEATGLAVHVLDDRLNAVGNTLLVGDLGGLAGPEYSATVTKAVEATLGIRLSSGPLAGLPTVGMAGVATRRGVLVHAKATADEREAARRALGVDVMMGTINHGTGLIGAGLVANSKGALIGAETTGIEIGRIEEALGFLDAPAKG